MECVPIVDGAKTKPGIGFAVNSAINSEPNNKREYANPNNSNDPDDPINASSSSSSENQEAAAAAMKNQYSKNALNNALALSGSGSKQVVKRVASKEIVPAPP